MVFANLGSKLKVCAKKRGAQLGNEFLAGVTFVAKALPADVALDARRVLRG
jgi:hypothetical protein